MASALLDSLLASGGGSGTILPKISETTERLAMKFLPDVKLSKEARIKKKIYITWLVCKSK